MKSIINCNILFLIPMHYIRCLEHAIRKEQQNVLYRSASINIDQYRFKRCFKIHQFIQLMYVSHYEFQRRISKDKLYKTNLRNS